jgi:cystathionine gamma-lyase
VGAIPAPWDCFLVLRGTKTLHLRMNRHSENALFIAKNLSINKHVSRVYYPGLETSSYFNLARTQMKQASGMVSFVVKNDAWARHICEKTQIFTCAESLGGVESLIEHPASMTHASVDALERKRIGIDDGLVRISVGLEDQNDLWSDLEQAIESFN